jgi:hypothetical protein
MLHSKRAVKVAIIDPGTNTAIRYCVYRLNEQNNVMCEIVAQDFIPGTASGTNYVQRMSMLTRTLVNQWMFKVADLYVIESQFENNVSVTLGVIMGIISGIRLNDVTLRTKRTGMVTVDKISYEVMTIHPAMKSSIILQITGTKPKAADIKILGVQAAINICEKYNDQTTLTLMKDSSKNDDIADTVCYAEALLRFIIMGK